MYNSAWIIERCLNALLAQQVPSSVLWEIIVVNNASTDDTERIANKVLQKGHISYQLINEPRQVYSMQENVELERLDIHILYFVMMTMCFAVYLWYQQCMIKWKKILDWERVVA
ncbi:MAG: glycosyltransferase family A protein [Phocaeicola vulgatus]